MVYIQCQIFQIIVHHKKHETLITNPPVHIYINSINTRPVLEIKDGYKLELQNN